MDAKFVFECYERGVLSKEEAIKLLGDNQSNAPEVTYDEEIEKLVNETVSSMKIDEILEIMQSMDWKYYKLEDFSGYTVTREAIIDTMKTNVRTAINGFFENASKEKSDYYEVSTGGFRCICSKDDDSDYLEIELQFIPYEEFCEGNYDKLMKLYKNK